MKKPVQRAVQNTTDWHSIYRTECGHGVLWLPEGLAVADIAAQCNVKRGRCDSRRLAKLFGVPLTWLRGIDITLDSLATLTYADMLRWIPTDNHNAVERQYRDCYQMQDADSPDKQEAHAAAFAYVVRLNDKNVKSEHLSEIAKKTSEDKLKKVAELVIEDVPGDKIKTLAHVGHGTIDRVKKDLQEKGLWNPKPKPG